MKQARVTRCTHLHNPALQLREAGVPLDNIQLGRADDDDDEEWLDVLDAETDEWMRKPQVCLLFPSLFVLLCVVISLSSLSWKSERSRRSCSGGQLTTT